MSTRLALVFLASALTVCVSAPTPAHAIRYVPFLSAEGHREIRLEPSSRSRAYATELIWAQFWTAIAAVYFTYTKRATATKWAQMGPSLRVGVKTGLCCVMCVISCDLNA